MRNKLKLLTTTFLGLMCWTMSSAQTFFDKMRFSASLESNNIYYIQDKNFDADLPEDRFGSNSYLKLDLGYGQFSAGMQLEAYLPALYGFEINQIPGYKKFILGSKYISWKNDFMGVYAGNIYDQFGNGLIYRSYEDRALGLNNSLEGVQASFNIKDFVRIKGMIGRPRFLDSYAGSWVRGADLVLDIANMAKLQGINLALEGAFVNRYESLYGADDLPHPLVEITGQDTPNVNMASASLDFGWNGLSLKAEYAYKTKDSYNYQLSKGYAAFVEALYSWKTLSVSGSFRVLDHMGTMLTLASDPLVCNNLNYLPALTRQYHYSLANLDPYSAYASGELAGQADFFYTLRKNRSQYWVFHVNYSTAFSHKLQTNDGKSSRMLWSDANLDVECHWNREWKSTFLYSRQQKNHAYGYDDDYSTSHIMVADVQYKFLRKYAVRAELQYLFLSKAESKLPVRRDEEGDWISALLEFSIAPNWNIFVSDMYYFGSKWEDNPDMIKKVHYYNAGVSYSKGPVRLQLSYGRNRAGMVCSGGVCRFTPAYTGLNFLLSTTF